MNQFGGNFLIHRALLPLLITTSVAQNGQKPKFEVRDTVIYSHY